ncbi:hypothetical protein V8C40DRAFT_234096 [Trichoderma camerunense]
MSVVLPAVTSGAVPSQSSFYFPRPSCLWLLPVWSAILTVPCLALPCSMYCNVRAQLCLCSSFTVSRSYRELAGFGTSLGAAHPCIGRPRRYCKVQCMSNTIGSQVVLLQVAVASGITTTRYLMNYSNTR